MSNDKESKKSKKSKKNEASAKPLKPLKKEKYESELAELQTQLVILQEWVRRTGQKVAIVFEGRDAAGKGGVIKRITESISPRLCKVVAARPHRARAHPVVLPALRAAPASRRRDGDLRPQLVQPSSTGSIPKAKR